MTFKEYASKAEATAEIQAIDKALGNPRRPSYVGSHAAEYVPAEYVEGAIGWTKTECSIEEAADKTALVALTEAATSLGKLDVVVDGKTVSLDFTKDVLETKPEKYEGTEVIEVEALPVEKVK